MTTGEFALIARLSRHLASSGTPLAGGDGDAVTVGHGDDAAVLRLGGRDVVLAVDVVVDRVHVRRDVSSPGDVGWKAVAVNCSDLAAMGATPSAAVIGLCRPDDLAVADLTDLYAGAEEAGRAYGLVIVGGDTVRADQLVVSVTVLGTVEPGRAVTRAGARPGDRLVCVGALGGAAAALAALGAGRRPADAHLAAHRRPRALVAAGRALAAAGARAMIDVSDGLGADLGHVCAASGVRARVRWDALPVAQGAVEAATQAGVDPVRLVAGGGEDFALLAALPAHLAEAAAVAGGEAEGVPAAVVGEILEPSGPPGPAAVLELGDGDVRDLTAFGWDHYAEAPSDAAPDRPPPPGPPATQPPATQPPATQPPGSTS